MLFETTYVTQQKHGGINVSLGVGHKPSGIIPAGQDWLTGTVELPVVLLQQMPVLFVVNPVQLVFGHKVLFLQQQSRQQQQGRWQQQQEREHDQEQEQQTVTQIAAAVNLTADASYCSQALCHARHASLSSNACMMQQHL